jgi:hypothetical protein
MVKKFKNILISLGQSEQSGDVIKYGNDIAVRHQLPNLVNREAIYAFKAYLTSNDPSVHHVNNNLKAPITFASWCKKFLFQKYVLHI